MFFKEERSRQTKGRLRHLHITAHKSRDPHQLSGSPGSRTRRSPSHSTTPESSSLRARELPRPPDVWKLPIFPRGKKGGRAKVRGLQELKQFLLAERGRPAKFERSDASLYNGTSRNSSYILSVRQNALSPSGMFVQTSVGVKAKKIALTVAQIFHIPFPPWLTCFCGMGMSPTCGNRARSYCQQH